jgi:hypothetical protein
VTPANEQNSRLSSRAGAEDIAPSADDVVGDGTFASFLQILQNSDRETEQRQLIAPSAI